MKKSFIKTGSSLGIAVIGMKFLRASLTSTKGFLAANSKFVFMNTFPVPNAAIIMLILSGIGAIYLWHLDINK